MKLPSAKRAFALSALVPLLLSTTALSAVPDDAGVLMTVTPSGFEPPAVQRLSGSDLIGRAFLANEEQVRELILVDGTTIRLAPGSHLIVEDYAFDDETDLGELAIRVEEGSVWVTGGQINRAGVVRIATPAGSGELRDGAGIIEVDADGMTTTQLLFGRGLVFAANGDSEEIYRPGFEVQTEVDAEPGLPQRLEAGEAEQVAYAFNPALAPASLEEDEAIPTDEGAVEPVEPAAGPAEAPTADQFVQLAALEETQAEADEQAATENAVADFSPEIGDDLSNSSNGGLGGSVGGIGGGGLAAGGGFGPGRTLGGYNLVTNPPSASDGRETVLHQEYQKVDIFNSEGGSIERERGLSTNVIFSTAESATQSFNIGLLPDIARQVRGFNEQAIPKENQTRLMYSFDDGDDSDPTDAPVLWITVQEATQGDLHGLVSIDSKSIDFDPNANGVLQRIFFEPDDVLQNQFSRYGLFEDPNTGGTTRLDVIALHSGFESVDGTYAYPDERLDENFIMLASYPRFLVSVQEFRENTSQVTFDKDFKKAERFLGSLVDLNSNAINRLPIIPPSKHDAAIDLANRIFDIASQIKDFQAADALFDGDFKDNNNMAIQLYGDTVDAFFDLGYIDFYDNIEDIPEGVRSNFYNSILPELREYFYERDPERFETFIFAAGDVAHPTEDSLPAEDGLPSTTAEQGLVDRYFLSPGLEGYEEKASGKRVASTVRAFLRNATAFRDEDGSGGLQLTDTGLLVVGTPADSVQTTLGSSDNAQSGAIHVDFGIDGDKTVGQRSTISATIGEVAYGVDNGIGWFDDADADNEVVLTGRTVGTTRGPAEEGGDATTGSVWSGGDIFNSAAGGGGLLEDGRALPGRATYLVLENFDRSKDPSQTGGSERPVGSDSNQQFAILRLATATESQDIANRIAAQTGYNGFAAALAEQESGENGISVVPLLSGFDSKGFELKLDPDTNRVFAGLKLFDANQLLNGSEQLVADLDFGGLERSASPGNSAFVDDERFGALTSGEGADAALVSVGLLTDGRENLPGGDQGGTGTFLDELTGQETPEGLKWGFFFGDVANETSGTRTHVHLGSWVAGGEIVDKAQLTNSGKATYRGPAVGNVIAGGNNTYTRVGRYRNEWNFGSRTGLATLNFDDATMQGFTQHGSGQKATFSGVLSGDQRQAVINGAFIKAGSQTRVPGGQMGNFAVVGEGDYSAVGTFAAKKTGN